MINTLFKKKLKFIVYIFNIIIKIKYKYIKLAIRNIFLVKKIETYLCT